MFLVVLAYIDSLEAMELTVALLHAFKVRMTYCWSERVLKTAKRTEWEHCKRWDLWDLVSRRDSLHNSAQLQSDLLFSCLVWFVCRGAHPFGFCCQWPSLAECANIFECFSPLFPSCSKFQQVWDLFYFSFVIFCSDNQNISNWIFFHCCIHFQSFFNFDISTSIWLLHHLRLNLYINLYIGSTIEAFTIESLSGS